MEAEVGVFAALNPPPSCSAYGCYFPDDRFIWVPFGLRFYAPVSLKWLDASAGGGGLHEKYSVSNPNLIMAALWQPFILWAKRPYRSIIAIISGWVWRRSGCWQTRSTRATAGSRWRERRVGGFKR